MGNVIMQMLAMGELNSLSEGRQLIRKSVDIVTFYSQQTQVWEEASERLEKIRESLG